MNTDLPTPMPSKTEKPINKHAEIIAFIRAVRTSFPDATLVYTHGGCYGFYGILKQLYPTAIAHMTADEDHIVTQIDGRYYDICGEFVNLQGKTTETLVPLTLAQHEYWEGCVTMNRIERMVAKFNASDERRISRAKRD